MANMNIKSIKLSTSWKIFWGLIALSAVSFFFAIPHGQKSNKLSTSKINPTPKLSSTKIPSPTNNPIISKKLNGSSKKNSVVITTPVPTNSNGSTSGSTSSSGGSSQSVELQVSVSISPGGNFSLTVPSGSNQCDVLSKALSNGKISSLSMRFNSSLGTYGVYQINGVGKDNAVWWTYKVNGQSPSQGCSFIKVNNGDRIEWNYIGN